MESVLQSFYLVQGSGIVRSFTEYKDTKSGGMHFIILCMLIASEPSSPAYPKNTKINCNAVDSDLLLSSRTRREGADRQKNFHRQSIPPQRLGFERASTG